MSSGFGFHTSTLTVRFVLELVSLACFAVWAWTTASGPLRYVLVVAAPVLVAVLWGVFATPGDKSRSGETVVATPGAVRLLLELAVFFGGAVALYAAGSSILAITLAGVLIIYHALSWDRVVWLLRH
ncbi:YrdB family protein [Streptomyces venezuelae]|uniref:YrdB family protein n=1 Tax=Streptomyces venezuelae TaxID=54571 RepID=UPI00278BBEBF|nr:YrdB family protein [Streptomyces venezuelae]